MKCHLMVYLGTYRYTAEKIGLTTSFEYMPRHWRMHTFFSQLIKWLIVSGRKKRWYVQCIVHHYHSQLNHINNYEICCKKVYVSNITLLQNILRWKDANKLKTKKYQYKWSSSNLGKWRLREIYYRSSFMLDNNIEKDQ